MESEITSYCDNKRILRGRPTQIVEYDPNQDDAPRISTKVVLEEKVLVVSYNDGDSVKQLKIHDLAEQRNGQTKEQRVTLTVLEGKGHIGIVDNGETTIVRVSSIISVTSAWVPVEKNA